MRLYFNREFENVSLNPNGQLMAAVPVETINENKEPLLELFTTIPILRNHLDLNINEINDIIVDIGKRP